MRRRVNGAAPLAERPATLRCAIYTRKSTEEGLDQDFNSLDAQREASEAFIQSQRGEGWEVLPERYDDGGFSGGNIERPALRRLIDDIKAGRVHAVVVYKVDRLSRSLLDFAKIMETFDAHKVAFVSVTQQFNTATSMGRLVLHILLSFAQFEREMIAERTRDKMSAARKKGKWVGGSLILGYDVDPRGGRLVVNEAEAARVREIFALYLKEQSLLGTAIELNTRGWTTEAWTTKSGREHVGGAFTKSNVFGLLTNVAYTGQVHYRGTLYPGEHPAIVERDVWQRAQDRLRHNARTGGSSRRNKHGALLKELLRCGPCDAAMVATYTMSGTKRYRYYVCGKAQKQGWAACPTRAVPANEIERYMVEQIRAIAHDPAVLKATLDGTRARFGEHASALETERLAAESDHRRLHGEMRKLLERPEVSTERLAELQDRLRENERRRTDIRERAIAAGRDRVDAADVAAALSHFDPVWDQLFPREQARILRILLRTVRYDGASGSLNFRFRPAGIKALAEEAAAGRTEALR